jgi:surface polysaccharide O-acyltransferase-like enzyme
VVISKKTRRIIIIIISLLIILRESFRDLWTKQSLQVISADCTSYYVGSTAKFDVLVYNITKVLML